MTISKLIMVSQSADISSSPVGAMVACLATVVLDINDNAVAEFRNNYRQWFEHAKPFASKYGFGPEFRSVSKRIIRGDDMFGDDDDVVDLGTTIKRNRKAIYEDTGISREMFKLLIMSARCLAKDDERAWQYLEKNISLIKNTRLTSVFLPDEDEPIEIDGLSASSASTQMRALYKKITGDAPKYGYFINPQDAKAYREKNPTQWEEYAKLSRVLTKEVKRQVFRYVRNKQQERVSVDEVSKYLDKQGLLHNLPRGFVGGMIGDDMSYYTAAGKKLDKAPIGLVRMNPKYDPAQDNTYVMFSVAYGKNEKGGDASAGRIRTESMNAANKIKRHAVAHDFLNNEDKIRAKWLRDLKRKGTKEQIMATMVELLWATSARIGGKGNKTAGETTYGLSTLRADHVKIKGTKLLFDYVGKKMASQAASYNIGTAEGKLVGEVMKKLLDDAAGDEMIFQFRGRPIIRHAISKYLTSLGTNMSAHSFRRVTGSRMALEILNSNPFKAKVQKGAIKETEVNRWFKAEMTKIGEALHHRNGEKVTGITAIKSYIDPSIIENFYASLGLRVPAFVPIAKGKD